MHSLSAAGRLRPRRPTTGKLELPSLSQVQQSRGPPGSRTANGSIDLVGSWYNQPLVSRTPYSPKRTAARLPSFTQLQSPSTVIESPHALVATLSTHPSVPASRSFAHAYSVSGVISPPSTDTSGLSASGHSQSASSSSLYSNSYTNSPQPQVQVQQQQHLSSAEYAYAQDAYAAPNSSRNATGTADTMNAHAQPSYLDMHHSHLSGGQHSAPQTVTSGMSHYSQYGQPPLLQPGPGNYSPAQSSYGSYGYSNGVASPQTATHAGSGGMIGSQVPPQLLPLPGRCAGHASCTVAEILT